MAVNKVPMQALDASTVHFLRGRVIELEATVVDNTAIIDDLIAQRDGDGIIIEELMSVNSRIEARLEEMAVQHNIIVNKINGMTPQSTKSPKVSTVSVTTTNKHANNILDAIRASRQPN